MVSAPTPYLEEFFKIAVQYIFPLIGVACIVEPYIMTDYAPLLLGTLMILGGIYSHLEAIRHKTYSELANVDMATSLMMVVVGSIILFKRDNAIEFMGYVWGLLGIIKGARLFDQSIYYAYIKQKWLLKVFWGIANIFLGVFLLIDPAENFSHHVVILGFELIAYSAQHLNVPSFLMNKLKEIKAFPRK